MYAVMNLGTIKFKGKRLSIEKNTLFYKTKMESDVNNNTYHHQW